VADRSRTRLCAFAVGAAESKSNCLSRHLSGSNGKVLQARVHPVALLFSAKALGLPVDESVPGFRGVMDNDEERVALLRADDIELHGCFCGRGGGGLAGASAHGSIRQLNALLPGKKKPSFRSGMLVRHDLGFRAEVGFGNDDLIARTRRNRREQIGLRNKSCARGALAFCGKCEKPDFASRFHDRTRGSRGVASSLGCREILEAPNQRSGRQDVEIPVQKDGTIRVEGPLPGRGGVVAPHGAGHVGVPRIHLGNSRAGRDHRETEAKRKDEASYDSTSTVRQIISKNAQYGSRPGAPHILNHPLLVTSVIAGNHSSLAETTPLRQC
jgi:hypothetical protein